MERVTVVSAAVKASAGITTDTPSKVRPAISVSAY